MYNGILKEWREGVIVKEYDKNNNEIHTKNSNGFEKWYNSDGNEITQTEYEKIHA